MKQEILNILNSHDPLEWSFENLQVKLSPHTPPIRITKIFKVEKEWVVEFYSVDLRNEMSLSEIESRETLATIYQRLKYTIHASAI